MSDGDLPEIDLKIDLKIAEVKAQPRALTSMGSQDAVDDLRDMFGIRRKKRITPLKRLVDVLDDPNYDPDNPPENEFEEPVSAEEELIGSMAAEMTAEIDNEIRRALHCPEQLLLGDLKVERPRFDVVLKVETARAMESTNRGP